MIKNNQIGSIHLVLLGVCMFVAIGASGYFVFKANTKDGTKTSSNSRTSSKAAKCDTDKCFQAKFIKCEPVSLQQDAVFEGGAKVYYEVIGGDVSNCKMLHRYDSDNLDLICTYHDMSSYDTGEDSEFVIAASDSENDIAFGRESNCTGPMADRLKKLR